MIPYGCNKSQVRVQTGFLLCRKPELYNCLSQRESFELLGLPHLVFFFVPWWLENRDKEWLKLAISAVAEGRHYGLCGLQQAS